MVGTFHVSAMTLRGEPSSEPRSGSRRRHSTPSIDYAIGLRRSIPSIAHAVTLMSPVYRNLFEVNESISDSR